MNIPELKDEEIIYISFPEKKEFEEYQTALDYLISEFLDVEDVVSIYNYGTISVPGISDIDILLVLEDEVKNPRMIKNKIEEISSKYRYLFWHKIAVINRSSMEYLPYLVPIKKLDKIHGEKIKLREEKFKERNTVILIDKIIRTFFVSHMTPLYFKKFISKNNYVSFFMTNLSIIFPYIEKISKFRIEYRIRELLCGLNAFSYEIKMFEGITGYNLPKKWLDYMEDVQTLRNQWFEDKIKIEEKINKIKELLIKRVFIDFDIVYFFSDYLKNNVLKIEGLSQALLLSPTRKIFFTENWEKNKVLEILIKALKKKVIFQILPLEYAIQLFYNSDAIIYFDKKTRDMLNKGKVRYEHSYEEVVIKRNNVMEKYHQFLNKYGLNYPRITPLFRKINTNIFNRIFNVYNNLFLNPIISSRIHKFIFEF